MLLKNYLIIWNIIYIRGVDWGYTHPCAITIKKITLVITITDEFYKTGRTESEIVDKASLCYKVYPDPENASGIESLRI
jgi:hypothetical protein